jgi:hypothetical protein
MRVLVRRSTYVPLRRFLGDVRCKFMPNFLWFFMTRSVPILVMPCKRVVQLLLHASLLRGPRLLYLLNNGIREAVCNIERT